LAPRWLRSEYSGIRPMPRADRSCDTIGAFALPEVRHGKRSTQHSVHHVG
jgi:hypothetical protein